MVLRLIAADTTLRLRWVVEGRPEEGCWVWSGGHEEDGMISTSGCILDMSNVKSAENVV